MFDTYVSRREEHHHQHRSEVHEHRAPTDASVKLLKEMEEAALGKILATIRLEGCPVDCVILHQRDVLHDAHNFIVRYKLGAHAREFRHDYRPRLGLSAQEVNDECFAALRSALAEDIAHYLLAEPFVQTLKRSGFDLARV